jgi:hypothetical protein
MSDLNLTQKDLNQSLRGMTDADIIMFLPDKGISFPSNAVSLNKQALPYTSNLRSILEFSSLPQANLATFENNLWILDGSFISPSQAYGGGGDSYTGYISNDYTDDNGDYSVNPILTVTLTATVPKVEYISMKFAGGVNTSYPKVLKIRTFNGSIQVQEHVYDMSIQTGLPLLVLEIMDENVNKLEFEFVGTVCPHRRSRLHKIMFGKAEQVNPYYLQSWSVDDKASLVADSIPTKLLTYSVIDYTGSYDIDNPGAKVPNNYKDVQVLFTLGMEQNGLWKYAPTKTFNLIDISTTPDGVVTFSCGSLLDILTTTYDHDIYTGPKTIGEIMYQLLSFSDVSTDQCVLNEFANYQINIPLPELPVREIIQRLAFSCGATLIVDDDNRIIFSKKNIIPNDSTPKFMFDEPKPFDSAAVILEEPHAEALANTNDIAMYVYTSIIDENLSELGTASVSTISPTRISFSPTEGIAGIDEQAIEAQGARLRSVIEVYSQHAVIELNWQEGEATPPIEVKVYGKKVETRKSSTKLTITPQTLLLDSGIASTQPTNFIKNVNSEDYDENTFYYSDWYKAKFKYKFKTRNEYLIKAGDIILFETPFSNGQPTLPGYVLRNIYSNNDDGEMEVIAIYADD